LIDPMIPGVINPEAEVEISGKVLMAVESREMTLGSTTEEDQMN